MRKRAPREAPPPSMTGRTKANGHEFRVRQLSKRNDAQKKQYRLIYRVDKSTVVGTKVWTLDELNAAGVVWD